MQKTIYMTEDTWDKLKSIANGRSYSEVIRDLINSDFDRQATCAERVENFKRNSHRRKPDALGKDEV